MNFDNLLHIGQAQSSSTEQLTPDAVNLKRALQGALQMWGICVSEDLKPGGQTEVNTLGSSPRSIANQLMVENDNWALASASLCDRFSGHMSLPLSCDGSENVCSNKPKLPLLHEETWLFFHYHIGWHKNISTFKAFTDGKVLPVVAFSDLYFPPPVLVLRMLCGKGCQVQSLWKQFISNYNMLF